MLLPTLGRPISATLNSCVLLFAFPLCVHLIQAAVSARPECIADLNMRHLLRKFKRGDSKRDATFIALRAISAKTDQVQPLNREAVAMLAKTVSSAYANSRTFRAMRRSKLPKGEMSGEAKHMFVMIAQNTHTSDSPLLLLRILQPSSGTMPWAAKSRTTSTWPFSVAQDAPRAVHWMPCDRRSCTISR